MILTQLSVKNFKCFEDSDLNFSKLNIFTGPNSSGKSAMLGAILAVAQSSQDFPFQLSPNGKYITMGDCYEFVRNHDLTHPMEIAISLADGEDETVIRTIWTNDESTNMPILKSLEAKAQFIQLSISKNRNYEVHIKFDEHAYKESPDYETARLITDLMSQLTRKVLSEPRKTRLKNIKPTISHDTIDFQIENCDDISAVLMKENLVHPYYTLLTMENRMRQFESAFNYISSFRLKPERTYTQKTVSEPVQSNGDNSITQVFHWKTIEPARFRRLIRQLRDMQLLAGLSIKKYRGGRYEVRIKTKSLATWASLVDVGFGISQFLPVIVADLQLPKGSTLVIDQPELHLHPSAQAQLGDYFAYQINKHNACYFIETHSEYLLNRVRALIVKAVISPSDVAVYYFDNHGDCVDIHQVRFTKDGRILDAPKSFFDTYMIDVMDIAINAAQHSNNDERHLHR